MVPPGVVNLDTMVVVSLPRFVSLLHNFFVIEPAGLETIKSQSRKHLRSALALHDSSKELKTGVSTAVDYQTFPGTRAQN
jgi:hypothetical protein